MTQGTKQSPWSDDFFFLSEKGSRNWCFSSSRHM